MIIIANGPINEYIGFETFTLDFQVDFPVSLIISKKSITKYQLIFRHLFYLKFLERNLSQTWARSQSLKKAIRGKGDDLKQFMKGCDVLRHRMLNFVQNLEYYSCFEVLEPQWNTFENKMKEQASNFMPVLEFLNCSFDI